MCCECVQLCHCASIRRSANQIEKSQDHKQACVADVSISHLLHGIIALHSVSCNNMPIHFTKRTECQTCHVASQSNHTCPSSSRLLGFWESAVLFQIFFLDFCADNSYSLCKVAGNSRHIQALISLAKVLRSAVQVAKPEQQRVQTVNDFLFNSALDGVNMFKLLRQVLLLCCLFTLPTMLKDLSKQS